MIELKQTTYSLIITGGLFNIAPFAIAQESLPTKDTRLLYHEKDYYGNGQTDSFNRALYGAGGLTDKEKHELNALVPESHENRWTIRFGLNAGSTKVTDIKNISGNAATIGQKVVQDGASSSSQEFSIAGGYVWTKLRLELEYFATPDIKYNSSFTGAGVTFTSKISSQTLLGNIAYEFSEFFIFKPYAIGTLGLSRNKATFSVNNATSPTATSITKNGIAYGLGVGARANVISKLYADANIRYLKLGGLKFQDDDLTLMQSATLTGAKTWTGIGLSLIWLF